MVGRRLMNRALTASVIAAVLSAGVASAFVMRSTDAAVAGGILNPHHASIEKLGGAVSDASAGEALEIGSRLVTAASPDASATVVVGERLLLLGANTSIVRDSLVSFVLERGSLIGTGRGANPFVVHSDQIVVEPARDAVWRIDRGFTTRIVSYTGTVEASNDLGSTVEVTALHQASAAGASLPELPGPLALTTGDPREREVAPLLVALDAYLARVAAGFDTDATQTAALNVVARQVLGLTSAQFTGSVSEAISERLLPALIARASAARSSGAYAAAKGLRADGGSWGVVALLSGVTTIDPLQQAVSVMLDLAKIDVAGPSTEAPTANDSRATNPERSPEPSADQPASQTPPSSVQGPSKTASPTSPPAPPTDPIPTDNPSVVDELLTNVVHLLGLDPTKAPSLR